MKHIDKLIVGLIAIAVVVGMWIVLSPAVEDITIEEAELAEQLGVKPFKTDIKTAEKWDKVKPIKEYIADTVLDGEIPHFEVGDDFDAQIISDAYLEVYTDLGGKKEDTAEKDLWKAIREKAKEKHLDVKEPKLK